MADKQTIVVLNIGAQRVGMARFRNLKAGLQLVAYESTEILADPAAASSRNAQIKIAVLELARKLDVKNRVSYAVSGQSVFTRFVLLPDLDGVDKQELVTNEAQQNIPFSLDEVKWDWQELAEVDGEREVVIAAIKSKILNDIQDAVEGAGMYTTEVDPSPTALYNAFRLSYPDVTEPVMLLDIGAKTSNVIYIDGERFFCRSIAIGGATVTTAIAKEYNVSFTEAEAQKLTNGTVALDTRHTSKMDELTAALATCIRTSLNRMPAEISRTTNFYRSQQGGSAPVRVYLAGGGANLPKLTSFLHEKLRLPCEFFNPLRGVIVDKKMDLDTLSGDAHMLGELVGLAARRAGKATITLELVPDSVGRERELDKRKSKLVIGAGGFVLALIVYWGFSVYSNSLVAEASENLEVVLKEEIERPAASMRMDVQRQNSALKDVNNLVQVQKDRVQWIGILNELKQTYCSKKFWFTEIVPLVDFKPDTPVNSVKSRVSLGSDSQASIMEDNNGVVNAILVKGVWLESSHQIAETTNELLGKELSEAELKKLKATAEDQKHGKSHYFSRFLKYPAADQKAPARGKANVVKLAEASFGGDKMFKIKPQWDESKIGSEFTIILPLKNPIIEVNK